MINSRRMKEAAGLSKKLFFVFGIILCIFFLLLIPTSLAIVQPNNDSIQAKALLNQAEKDIIDMASRNISILRVNETYQEALQIYSAQIALEEKGGKASYNLINEYAAQISAIKKTALEANDELKVFQENYEITKKKVNLSEMQGDYDQIILSFNEERFEDTLALIKEGYDRISEIESSQTAINAVYTATSKTIKNFFIKNWLRLLIICFIIAILLFIFWKTITKIRMRIRLNNLILQKKAINNLIKELQLAYFKNKKISETEYGIKLKNYEGFIRDIDRQIMVLKDNIFKMNKDTKLIK